MKVKDPRAKKLEIDVLGDVFDVVVRTPSRQEWKAFKALRANSDENKAAAANEQLLLNCTMFPDPKTNDYNALFDRYPGVIDTLWTQVAQMAGMGAKVEAGE